MIQVRDLLLWNDVYIGEAMSGGSKTVNGASEEGSGLSHSAEGSENGDAKVAEIGNDDMDKLQVSIILFSHYFIHSKSSKLKI